MFTTLCLLAGFTALLSVIAVALALVPAIGLGVSALFAAPVLGVVSLGAGLGAAAIALARNNASEA